jgi:futalosine hydrolase
VILVVCALRAELRGITLPAGVEIAESGVGPVEAAIRTAALLATGSYRSVVNAGIGGAFRGRASIGEGVIVAEERLADFGLEGGGRLTLPDGARLVDRAFAADELLAAVEKLPYRTVSGLSVVSVTTTDETAQRLSAAYDTDVESMEGFAVLRACERAGIPGIEVRGISNYVGARERAEWDFGTGASACRETLEAVLQALTP